VNMKKKFTTAVRYASTLNVNKHTFLQWPQDLPKHNYIKNTYL
jgi:hypothetical protein